MNNLPVYSWGIFIVDDFQLFYNNKFDKFMTPPKSLKNIKKSKSFVWLLSFLYNRKMTKELKKVLILRLSALGDTIHTLPAAYAIKKTFPECKIGWVVEDKAQLFIKDNPIIDKCYVLPKKEWKKRGLFSLKNILEFKDIIDSINEEHYDAVLDTQQLFKSACILPFLNIKRKITLTGGRELYWLFSNEIYPETHKLFDPEYHVVKRNLEFAGHLGADTSEIKFVLSPAKDETKIKIDNLLAGIDKAKKVIAVSPATTWENKHWHEPYWSETIEYLKDKANIIFTGMEADNALIKRILDKTTCTNSINLAGKTNLEELAELFRRCDLVISPDSGSAHIAWAVSKPAVITLFSATAEKRSAPFGENCYVLAPQLDCRPCLKKNCRLKKDKNKCCKLIMPEQLISLIDKILL